MRLSRSLAILTCIMFGAAGLYMAYETTTAQNGDLMYRENLGDLLSDHVDTEIVQMDLVGQSELLGEVTVHYSWACPTSGFLWKSGQMGLEPDMSTAEYITATGPGWTVDIFSVSTSSNSGQWGCYTYVRDRADSGNPLVSMMYTNVGMPGVTGGDPTISDIPVYVWSNGMPVYYVTVWRWFGPGWWVPYHYWWYNSHNHPNWYYSCYNYWWWYYRWYGHPWYKWYNWYYTWWYWRYFYYWSTYFPY